MCRNIKIISICPTCCEKLSERTTQQWCREGRRKGVFGRCSTGVNYIEEEFRGQECKACIEVREAQMSQLDMQDFNQRRLGWRKRKNPNGGEASRETEPYDSEGGYCW
ncbi:hypothetical protein MGN70_000974 [Eutypa lata]|nr:hypothetical protein MGN70_000974 [Eutypa lata]